tara:strand:+ start:131 stop:670 length:540 start_codon:yes stop_codon:yes gene_type:complete
MVDQIMEVKLDGPISTLDELLSLFISAVEISRICQLSRSAANHWFETAGKERRAVPGLTSVVLLADYVGLSDGELGSVIRDLYRIRKEMTARRNRKKAAAKREAEKRTEGLREQRAKIREVRRRNNLRSYQAELDLEAKRLKELEQEAEQKELYLKNQARLRRIERLERRLHGDKNGNN